MPVTTPVTSTEATPGIDEVHIPPGVTSVKFMVLPTHTFEGPVIGATLTNTGVVARPVQPLPSVTLYVIVGEPGEIPVTTPALLTLPMEGSEEVQPTVTPVVASVRLVVVPT